MDDYSKSKKTDGDDTNARLLTNPETGLPNMTDKQKEKGQRFFSMYRWLATGFVIGLGIGIAFAIHNYGDTAKYEERLATTKQFDMVWAYMGAFLFLPLVFGMNMYSLPMKAGICLAKGNIRANMFFFKQAAENSVESSTIVLHEDGDLGLYNRANRGVHHFVENCIPVILAAQFTVYAYTLPTFVILTIYTLSRIAYQHGYTHRGWGFSGHYPGFFLGCLCMCTLNGLLFVAATKTIDF